MKAASALILPAAGIALVLTALAAADATSRPADEPSADAEIEARVAALERDMAEVGRVLLGHPPTPITPPDPAATPPPNADDDEDWQAQRDRNRDSARLANLERSVRQLEQRVGGPNRSVVTIDATGINQQISQIDRRVDAIERRLGNIERDLNRLDREVRRIR